MTSGSSTPQDRGFVGAVVAASWRLGHRLVAALMAPNPSVSALTLPSDRALMVHSAVGAGMLGLAHLYWVGLPSSDLFSILGAGLEGLGRNVLVLAASVLAASPLLSLLARGHVRQTARELAPCLKAVIGLGLPPVAWAAAAQLPRTDLATRADPEGWVGVALVIGALALVILVVVPALLGATVTALFLGWRHKLRVSESVRSMPALALALSSLFALANAVVELRDQGWASGYPPLVGVALTFAGPVVVLALCTLDLLHLHQTGGVVTPRARLGTVDVPMSLRALLRRYVWTSVATAGRRGQTVMPDSRTAQ